MENLITNYVIQWMGNEKKTSFFLRTNDKLQHLFLVFDIGILYSVNEQ